MASLTLVVGGVRSGKSRLAEMLARTAPPLTYLATAQAGDAEMAQRIALHRERRAAEQPAWRTIEEAWDVAGVLAAHRNGCLLLECLTLWVTNLLVGDSRHRALDDDAVRARIGELAEAIAKATGRIIVVSNETGCGIIPPNALARRFGDLLGEANQRLAAMASSVYWCVAGIGVPIKTVIGEDA
ncbi:MAG: bifunctional adenosylcobinamide kinase/adenosylcobinamide-phosphate guanylyltransferase [Gemmataceae bacterium]|nr:bifunctional adenosylcobinamide kinase/adenosylcobinamide-phosphate guanylyltransferase [Gemmataceae bacterium]